MRVWEGLGVFGRVRSPYKRIQEVALDPHSNSKAEAAAHHPRGAHVGHQVGAPRWDGGLANLRNPSKNDVVLGPGASGSGSGSSRGSFSITFHVLGCLGALVLTQKPF